MVKDKLVSTRIDFKVLNWKIKKNELFTVQYLKF